MLCQSLFDNMSQCALQLEKGTANASYYLPSYDLKQCTATVSDIKQKVEAVRAELLPKKKFAFSKKVSLVEVLNPSLGFCLELRGLNPSKS